MKKTSQSIVKSRTKAVQMWHSYTEHEIFKVKEWITLSIEQLIQRDNKLLNPSKIKSAFRIEGQKDLNREVHETTINHRLARYLEDYLVQYGFEEYHCDIEYNRYINNRKMVFSLKTHQQIEVRPDIIIHKRERIDEPIPHLLVIEAKKYSTTDKDRNHIHDLMWDNNYQYKYGLLISYYEVNETINCELLTLNDGRFIKHIFEVSKQKTN